MMLLVHFILLVAILKDEEFMGTAEELAAFVSNKLNELGFGSQHNTTERLVRFYVYQGIINKADRALDDRRKANFGPMQVRQLVIARLLPERGWDLGRIKSLLLDKNSAEKLNDLIDSLAIPTEAEKLLFKTKSVSFDKAESIKATRISRSMSIEDRYSSRDYADDSYRRKIDASRTTRKFAMSQSPKVPPRLSNYSLKKK
jgi:hypothetical protein